MNPALRRNGDGILALGRHESVFIVLRSHGGMIVAFRRHSGVILAFRRLRKEGFKFQATLSYGARSLSFFYSSG